MRKSAKMTSLSNSSECECYAVTQLRDIEFIGSAAKYDTNMNKTLGFE